MITLFDEDSQSRLVGMEEEEGADSGEENETTHSCYSEISGESSQFVRNSFHQKVPFNRRKVRLKGAPYGISKLFTTPTSSFPFTFACLCVTSLLTLSAFNQVRYREKLRFFLLKICMS